MTHFLQLGISERESKHINKMNETALWYEALSAKFHTPICISVSFRH